MNNEKVVPFTSTMSSLNTGENVIDSAISSIQKYEFERARDLLVKAVDNGDDEAYYYLANAYLLEPDSNPIHDYEKAHFYYCKAIETIDSIEAHIGIANMFFHGQLGKVDYKSAMNIYEDQIRGGYSAGGYLFWMLGVMYFKGQGVEKDFKAAKSFFKKGMRENHIPSLGAFSHLLFYEKRLVRAVGYKFKHLFQTLNWVFFDRSPARMRRG